MPNICSALTPKVSGDITLINAVIYILIQYKTSCYKDGTTYGYTIAYKCHINSLNKKTLTNSRPIKCLHD